MANTKDIQNIDSSLTGAIQSLAIKIETLVTNARQQLARVVNTAEVETKYEIGRAIVEEIQEGVERAAYGKRVLLPQFSLSWSHYLVLMRIDNADERRFYEIESQKENWSDSPILQAYLQKSASRAI